ncbi:cobalamin biosynthesis protein [Paraburkholderia acidisoli]|uniref:cobalamin biosynthesis protein n=1 Tax=Paraburkholderia acidisoli TaxID=2571748 RepID=UPI001E35BE18|nr:cobalamin biosynthesis protein [Paraburkholderia acidisoli]
MIGVGCRRGVTLAQVEAAVHAALGNWLLAQVAAVATLDAKASEPALHAFCAAHALTLVLYTREQIAAVPALAVAAAAPSPPSLAARAHYGVNGVCEPCAWLAANGGPLLRAKLALDGVTVAIARQLP